MLHFVYKTIIKETGEYYIGKHSANNINDRYIGSGVSILEKVDKSTPVEFKILEYAKTSDDAYILEEKILGDLYKVDPLCLNRVKGGKRGYANNRKGKSHSIEWRQKISKSNSKPKEGIALEATRNNAKLGAEARRGMKDSDEVKAKRAASLSKVITGVPQPNRRKTVVINNKKYIGVELVANEFNISRMTVYNRIKSNKWDWHYANNN